MLTTQPQTSSPHCIPYHINTPQHFRICRSLSFSSLNFSTSAHGPASITINLHICTGRTSLPRKMQRRSGSPQDSSREGSRQGRRYYSELEETSSSLLARRTRTDSASRSPPPSYTSTSRLAHADGVLPIYYFPTVEPLPPNHGLENVPRGEFVFPIFSLFYFALWDTIPNYYDHK